MLEKYYIKPQTIDHIRAKAVRRVNPPKPSEGSIHRMVRFYWCEALPIVVLAGPRKGIGACLNI